MNLIEVSAEKCVQCGSCRDECPAQIIAQVEDALPVPTDDAEERCIDCGHCVAVCPEGALTHRSMGPDDCPVIKDEWRVNPAQAEHFLRDRRSIRSYKNKPVDKETISKLIDIGRYAPSGHNRQPVSWHVIYDTDEVVRLTGMVVDWMVYMAKAQPELAESFSFDAVIEAWKKGEDRVCRGAPHVVVAHAPKEDLTAPVPASIALAYLELAVPSFGLGACWAGYFNMAATYWPAMKEALGLPKGHVPLGAMMLGHPRHGYARFMKRKDPSVSWK